MAKQPASGISPKEEMQQLERRLEELRSQLRGDAEAGLMQSLEDFNKMNFGVTYELRPARGTAAKARSGRPAKTTRKVDASRPCPVCGFNTTPPHDARAHRSQGANKRPFTAEELAEKGLVKAF